MSDSDNSDIRCPQFQVCDIQSEAYIRVCVCVFWGTTIRQAASDGRPTQKWRRITENTFCLN